MRRLWSGLIASYLVACQGGAGEIPTTTVERRDLVVGVEVSGTLRSIDSQTVEPPSIRGVWQYKIAFMAPEGAQVEAGAPILGFDTTELSQELQRKRNDLDAATTELEQHRASSSMQAAARALELAEAQGALRKAKLKADTPEELAQANEAAKARLDLELAEAKVAHIEEQANFAAKLDAANLTVMVGRRARASERIAEIEASLAKLRVKAARSGTIIYEANWNGEKPKVGDPAWRGRKLLEVAGEGGMRAMGTIDEVDLARAQEKQSAVIRLDALPDRDFRATVGTIGDSVGQTSWENPVKVAEVGLELEDPKDEALRPGMRFRGQIEVERRKDVVVIPADAVFVDASGVWAYRVRGADYQRVGIELGARGGTEVEVVSGLEPGDEVSLIDLEERR